MSNNLDIYRAMLSSELRLIAILSLPEISQSQIKKSAQLINIVDIERLKSQIDHHRVWSCVYCNVAKHFDKELPLNLIEYLKKKHQQNIIKTKQQFIASSEILHTLKIKEIPAIEIKGNPLAKKLFNDISKRYSKDIDILIPLMHFDTVFQCLQNMGYKSEQLSEILTHKKSLHFNSYKDIVFKKGNIVLETHVRLCPFETELSEHITQFFIYSKNNKHFSPEELIYLSWHGSYTSFHRLKWLVDIALYLKHLDKAGELDILKLIKLAEQLREKKSLFMSWTLANLLYDIPLPDTVRRYIFHSFSLRILIKLSLRVLNNPQNTLSKNRVLELFICDILLTDGISVKFKKMMRKIKPNSVDYATYPKIPSCFSFLYYFLRFFRIFHKYIANHKKYNL